MNEHDGLSEANIMMLHAFLCEYEKHIKNITSDKNLYNQYPHLKKFYKKLPTKLQFTKYKSTNAPARVDNVPKGFYMVYSKSTKLLSILYHLRNAFCHGKIEVEDNYVSIKDYNMRKRYFSAYAFISKAHFGILLKSITNNY